MLDLSMALWNLCLRGKVAKVLIAFLLISISISFLLIVVGLPAFSRSPRISYSDGETILHRPLQRAFHAKPLAHTTPVVTPSPTVITTPGVAVSASPNSPCISAIHRVEVGSSSNSSANPASSTNGQSNVSNVTPIPLPVVTVTPALPKTPTPIIIPTVTPSPTITVTPTPFSTPGTTTPTPPITMTPTPVVTISPTVTPPVTPLATATPVDGASPIATPTTPASDTATPYPTVTVSPTSTSKSAFKHPTFLTSVLLVGIPFNLPTAPLSSHLRQSPGCLNVSSAPLLNPDRGNFPFEIPFTFILSGVLLGTTTFYLAIYLVRRRGFKPLKVRFYKPPFV